MKKILTGALAAVTLGGAALATATPAAAQYYGHGGYYGGYGHHGGNGAAIGIGAGLLGLALGASLAQPHYYAPRYSYGYAPSYGYGYGGYGYAPSYSYGYAAPAYGYGYGYDAPRCRNHWRFDPYIGRNVLVQRCW